MKLLLLMAGLFFTLETGWLTNFDEAQKIAKEKNEYILLNFSGSDWCGPCIRLKREIFNSADFMSYAEKNLVLVNADFPRNKKNKLSKEQTKMNEALAEKYNPDGKFPFTLLLDANGAVIKKYDGFPDKPERFLAELNQLTEKK